MKRFEVEAPTKKEAVNRMLFGLSSYVDRIELENMGYAVPNKGINYLELRTKFYEIN